MMLRPQSRQGPALANPGSGWFIDDPWLTERLGRPALRLRERGAGPLRDALDALPRPAFVDVRVPVEQVPRVVELESLGMRIVDTTLTLERRAARPLPAMNGSAGAGVACRDARPGDEPAVVELARRGFQWSRFHQDPKIGDSLAGEIKARWVANYFRGARGDRLIVAEGEGDGPGAIAGFLLALAAGDGAMVIDLVAVAARHRGRGIAGAMTAACWAAMARPHVIRVGTQLANTAAWRAYQKMGFLLAHASHVLHLHLDGHS